MLQRKYGFCLLAVCLSVGMTLAALSGATAAKKAWWN